MSGFIGPSVPLGLVKSYDSDEHKIDGNARPNKSNISGSDDSSSDSDSESEKVKHSSGMIGPVLPKNFKFVGCSSGSSSEDDTYGPRPPSSNCDLSKSTKDSAAEEFEKRSQSMKRKLLELDDDQVPKKREDWMTVLPDVKLKAGLGLVERKFKGRGDDLGDRSVWTDEPGKKNEQKSKEKSKSKYEHVFTAERDSKLQQEIQAHNLDKRPESLLDIHSKKDVKSKKSSKDKKESSHKKSKKEKKEKKKKEKKKHKNKDKDEEQTGRRPFDRDTDMKVNQFDDAMKKKYIERAQNLGQNFGHGNQKFL